VLGRGGWGWRGRREVGTLEVVGGEVGHSTAYVGPELGHGLLYLRRVVVRLSFKCLCDPVDN
jgi:hypothetical protein